MKKAKGWEIIEFQTEDESHDHVNFGNFELRPTFGCKFETPLLMFELLFRRENLWNNSFIDKKSRELEKRNPARSSAEKGIQKTTNFMKICDFPKYQPGKISIPRSKILRISPKKNFSMLITGKRHVDERQPFGTSV